ncbi:MAG: helix-turn-helix transcriptional regulator [Terrisporobacter sp.]|uniref:helix-turn-helix domain-containing protein n=1 Tax=Terrisporobacter sp. TaxID=1965305 RepID=UPI002FC84A90
MNFNEKLLNLRKQKGLSQDELGEILDVSRQSISKWENGQSYPDFEKLILLSNFFDITLDELMKDVHPENNTSNSSPQLNKELENIIYAGKSFAAGSVKCFRFIGIVAITLIAILFIVCIMQFQ